MSRACDYSETASGAPTAEDLAALQLRLVELESRLRQGATDENSSLVPSWDESGGAKPSVNGRGPLWLPPSLSKFPSAIFLDIDCFKWAQLPIPGPNVNVPAEVMEILSRGNAVQDATSEYFVSIHVWFPFISRKRMAIGTSLWEGGPDLAMLFLSMLLITTREIHDGQDATGNPLYAAAKRFLSLLEGGGCLSLFHLQAMILVALYEFGHGIYPAAWMTVAQCARYMDMIGIPSFKESSIMLGSCSTWTEVEERRRVWWAVYILDRAICLGNKKRFTVPEPEDSFVLPVDDHAWNDGDPSRGFQVPLSTPITEPLGAFARLAQSAMLASQVITHCRTSIQSYRNNTPEPFDLGRITSLADTLTNMNRLVRGQLPKVPPESYFPAVSDPHARQPGSERCSDSDMTGVESGARAELPQRAQVGCSYLYFSYLAPRCLALSALILLMDAYACPENLRDGPGPGGLDAAVPKSPDELTMQVRAVTSLRETSLLVRDLGFELLEAALLPQAQERLSCLCLDALYGALATLHWLYKEGGDPEIHAALSDVARVIARVGMRWKLADEYLAIVHHHNVTTAMALKSTAFSAYDIREDDPQQLEYADPEYAVIPWSAHGPNKLTIKLALFCLCMMATGPESDIQSGYGPLHSWTKVDDKYVHNTSGTTVKSKPKDGAVHKRQAPAQPSGQGAAGPSRQQYAQGQYQQQGYYGQTEQAGQYGGDEMDVYEAQSQQLDSPPEYEDEEYDIPTTGSSARQKTYEVTVTKKRGSYFYTNRKGHQTETKKSLWTPIEGGWALKTTKAIYISRKWP